MTPHNDAKKSDIADTVIMPGDPKRAKFIADNYLSDVKLVSDVRLAFCYTGKYNGKKVSVMASGMGMPSMAIYAYELFEIYDVKNIIRLGSCQSRQKSIKLNDIILTSRAYTDSNFAYNYDGYTLSYIDSSRKLNDELLEKSNELNIDINLGSVFTSDIFYREKDIKSSDIKNCIGLEMETFILLYLANKFNKNATSVLTVSDSLYDTKQLSSKEREQSFKNAILLVLESIN